MSYVNIGRTDDPAYRYKMPALIGKVEGRGNGIKTVIVNIIEIGQHLHRDPDEINKFMGCELGAQTIFNAEQEKAIVNGAHKDDVLQELVNIYVDKFVLCPTCHYPETSYKFKLKRDEIYHKCKACGANDPLIDEGHKLCKYIINKEKLKSGGKGGKKKKDRKSRSADSSPPGDDTPSHKKDKEAKKAEKKAKKEAKKEKKRAKKEKKKKKKKKKDNSSDGSEEVWASEGAAPIVKNSIIETSSPAEAMSLAAAALAAYITEGKETRQVIEKLCALQVNYKLQPIDRCGILFTGVFSGLSAATDFVKVFNRFKTLFRQLVTGSDQELLACFDRHFTNPDNKTRLAVVPLLLQLFYKEEVLSDDALREWFSASDPLLDRYGIVDVGSLEAVKKKAAAFVQSLDDDSSSSSDSDSD